jgi:peptidoglycan/xylan/chitin deacetylase (PgdA/CDA1 family)
MVITRSISTDRTDRLLAILAHHRVGEPPSGADDPWYYVPEGVLAEQLTAVQSAGWEFVDVAQAVRGLSAPEELPPRSALLTFDDAYLSLLELGLPVLRDLNCPAVVFVPAGLVGGVSAFEGGVAKPVEPLCGWDELRALEDGGVSAQPHGLKHQYFSRLGAEAIQAELERSKQILEEGLGKTVDVFAFPYGDGGTDPDAVTEALERAGYRAACLYGGGPVPLPAADPYRLSRLTLGLDSDVVGEINEFL